MYIYIRLFFGFLLLFSLYMILRPEIFPRCDCCGKVKPYYKYKIRYDKNYKLTRNGQLCVCKACCRSKGINSLSRYMAYKEAVRRSEYTSPFMF